MHIQSKSGGAEPTVGEYQKREKRVHTLQFSSYNLFNVLELHDASSSTALH